MAEVGKSAEPKFTRAMVALIPFATAFARRGGDVESALAKHRIPISALSDPMMLVEANACYGAMEDMAILLDDPCFGAKLAVEAAETGTPAIRDAAAAAVTFGDFLSRFIVEIARLLDNVDHRLDVQSKVACFELRRKLTPRGATTQVTSVNIAFFVTLFRCGLGEVFDPARVTVLAPSIEGLPADFLPKRCLIKSAINGVRIVFPPEWLWAPFSLGWQIEEPHEDDFGDAQGERIVAHFGAVLEANIDQGELSLDRFADLVGLHPRRVQRLLSANRTSYRQLKEDVRRRLALDLLSNTETPITAIASQLGFSSVSAFDRAFKHWTGTTPTDFRRTDEPNTTDCR